MRTQYQFYVYIMASHNDILYIGVTNNLTRRVYEHQNSLIEGFSKKYQTHKLVYYECFCDINAAIRREKQLKKWNRHKKLNLIRTINPTLADWTEEWA